MVARDAKVARRGASVAVFAAILWIVPSGGTQGKGTLGDRFSHADIAIVHHAETGQLQLVAADRRVVAAVNAL